MPVLFGKDSVQTTNDGNKSQGHMKIASTMTIVPEHDYEALATLLSKEQKQDNRSNVNVFTTNQQIHISIDANDVASFRSQSNAIGQVLALFESAHHG